MGNDDRPNDDSFGKRIKNAVRLIRRENGDMPADGGERNDPVDPKVERAWAKTDTKSDALSKSPASEHMADGRDEPSRDTSADHEETEQIDGQGDNVPVESAPNEDAETDGDTSTVNSVSTSDPPGGESEESTADDTKATGGKAETPDGDKATDAVDEQAPSGSNSPDDSSELLDSNSETIDRTAAEYAEMLESRVETLEEELAEAETQLAETESQLTNTKQRLAETETELMETQDELTRVEEEFAAFQSIEPGIDDFQQSSVPIDEYVDALEEFVENLNGELERKDSVIQELKDQKSELVADAKAEAVETVATRFATEVRASLVRGIEQADESMPEGVRLTLNQFDEVLADYDISVVAPSVGKQLGGESLNREQVEVTQVDHAPHEEGAVVNVYEHGLERNGTIIKKPQVKLSEGPPPDEETGDEAATTDEADETSDGNESESSASRADEAVGAAEKSPTDGIGDDENTSDADEDMSEFDAEAEQDGDGAELEKYAEGPFESSTGADEDALEGNSASESHNRTTDRTVARLQVRTNEDQYKVGDTVEVSVRDDDGNPVPDALVTVSNGTEARTDSKGNASVTISTAGRISLTVRKAGDNERTYNPVSRTIDVEDVS